MAAFLGALAPYVLPASNMGRLGAGHMARQQSLQNLSRLSVNPMYRGAVPGPVMSAIESLAPPTGMITAAGTIPFMLWQAQKEGEARQQAKLNQEVAQNYYANTQGGQAAAVRSNTYMNENMPIQQQASPEFNNFAEFIQAQQKK